MGSFLSLLKTLFLPALFSLLAYLLITFVILPFVRRHRQRYSQYLPLTNISTHTSSLRERISDALMSFLLPSSWRRRRCPVDRRYSSGESDGSLFDDEEGEDMIGFETDTSRREELERNRSGGPAEERRLSRDLEEGFRDDSEEERSDDERATARQ